MRQKALGAQGLQASELGLGCMGMSEFYGVTRDEESLQTLDRALELGIGFWDTLDRIAPPNIAVGTRYAAEMMKAVYIPAVQ